MRAYFERLPDPENYEFLKPFVDLNKPVVSPDYSEVGLILPEHVLAVIPPQMIQEHKPYTRSPIGTGPWKVESWVDAHAMVLVPNEHYTLTLPPPIKRIIIRFQWQVKQLEDAMVRGELDMILSEAYVVPPARSDLAEARIKTMSRPSSTWEHLDFSLNYGPFKERAVREAMISAINRQQLVQTAYRGTGKVANGVVPSSNADFLDRDDFAQKYPEVAARYKLPIYPYDRVRAVMYTNLTSASPNEGTFRSQFDTFVSSEPAGYGMYEEKESNIFAPGETFLLYVEPVGYSYGNVTDENGDQLYTMNFTADFTISTPDSTVLPDRRTCH